MVTTRPGTFPRMTQESLFDETAAPLVPPRPTLEEAPGGGGSLQGLPALEDRHADGLR